MQDWIRGKAGEILWKWKSIWRRVATLFSAVVVKAVWEVKCQTFLNMGVWPLELQEVDVQFQSLEITGSEFHAFICHLILMGPENKEIKVMTLTCFELFFFSDWKITATTVHTYTSLLSCSCNIWILKHWNIWRFFRFSFSQKFKVASVDKGVWTVMQYYIISYHIYYVLVTIVYNKQWNAKNIII